MPDYQTLFRLIPAGIMVLDRNLAFLTANDFYLKMVGVRLEDLVGRYVFEAFPEGDERRVLLETSMRRALAGEANALTEIAYAIPDPTSPSGIREAWWSCRHQPVVNADGGIDGIIQYTEDVSALVNAKRLKDAIAAELQHRVGNLFSLMQIIARRTASHASDLSSFMEKFEERVASLARTHSYLVGTDWNRMTIESLINRHLLSEYAALGGQIRASGPPITLDASEAQMLSMAVHELTTNSLKHGALRDSTGRLTIGWANVGTKGFRFYWKETGMDGLRPSDRKGFGSIILDTVVPTQLSGRAERHFQPDGLSYAITVEDRIAPV